MDKAKALQQVKHSMEQDRSLPLVNTPRDIIPGDGNPNAKIMFIGEAGGYHESVQRKPFVGAAGKFLDQLLESVCIKREEVYISNMLKTRPPQNRDPFPEELKAFERYLDQEIEIIKPKIIVTLGRFSMRKFLPYAKISSIHGKPHVVDWKGKDVTIVPMFHPAAALRSLEIKSLATQDFKMLPEVLKNVEINRRKEKEQKTEQMQLV
jgi:DNA polymerase